MATDPAKQIAALADSLKGIGANLASLQKQMAATGATAGAVAATTRALASQASDLAENLPPVKPPPVAAGPKPIPASSQLPILNPRGDMPWPWGMGQNAQQFDDWERTFGPMGAVAAWTNLNQTWTWDDLRGGKAGKPDQLGKLYTDVAWAANIRPFAGRLAAHPDVPFVIMLPLTPTVKGISNQGKKGQWQNLGIWEQVTTTDLGLWKSVWKDAGAHLCYWAVKNNRKCVGACIGWELSGRWYAWSIGPQWRPFPDAWRWMAESFYAGIESVDPSMVDKIHLEFRVAGGVSQRLDGYSLRDVFPGKDFVRVLGISMHETAEENWGTPAGFQAELKTGANEVVDLCRETGLPLGLDEWNIRSGDHPPYEKKSLKPSAALVNFFNWLTNLPVPVAWCCWLQSSTSNALDLKWPGSQELSRQLDVAKSAYDTRRAAAAAIETRQQVAALEVMDSEPSVPAEAAESGSMPA